MNVLLINEWYNPTIQNLIHFFALLLKENFSWTGKRYYRKDFLPFSELESKSLVPEPQALSDLQKGKYTHVIFSDGTTLLYLSSQLKNHTKRIIIDTIDYSYIPRYYYENADFYFKAQYPINNNLIVKNNNENEGYLAKDIYRFCLTPSYKVTNIKSITSLEKKIDIFFNGSAWPQDRIKIISKIKSKKNINFFGGLYNRKDLPFNNVFPKDLFYNQLSYNNYINVIANSKICLNIRGNGENCFRQFEVLHLGSCLLTQQTNNYFSHIDSTDNYVSFENEKDILEKIEYYLEHNNERIEISNSGNNFFKEKLRPQKLVEYILDIVKEKR